MIESKNPSLTKFLTILKYVAIYYLSAKMICFAIPKILHMQFRVLHWQSYVPLVEISKQQHMWSFFGRSYTYNLFIGLTEFLIGSLIVFKRTRLIALLLLLALSINILILNIEFDINFALSHVTLDLILTLLLLLIYRKDLYQFFIVHSGRFNETVERPKRKFSQWLPYIFLTIISISYFVYSLYIKSKYIVDENIVGSYEIKSLKIDGNFIKLEKGNLGNTPMVFMEHNNQFVLSVEDTLTMGRYIFDDERIHVYLESPLNLETTSIIGTLNNNGIIGITNDNQSFELVFERIDSGKDYLNQLYK